MFVHILRASGDKEIYWGVSDYKQMDGEVLLFVPEQGRVDSEQYISGTVEAAGDEAYLNRTGIKETLREQAGKPEVELTVVVSGYHRHVKRVAEALNENPDEPDFAIADAGNRLYEIGERDSVGI